MKSKVVEWKGNSKDQSEIDENRDQNDNRKDQ